MQRFLSTSWLFIKPQSESWPALLINMLINSVVVEIKLVVERWCLAEASVSIFILFLKIPVRPYGSTFADFSGCWNMGRSAQKQWMAWAWACMMKVLVCYDPKEEKHSDSITYNLKFWTWDYKEKRALIILGLFWKTCEWETLTEPQQVNTIFSHTLNCDISLMSSLVNLMRYLF